MKCNCLLPSDLDGRVDNRGCLFQQGHQDNHLVTTNDGNYILWYPLDECFCDKIPCECFTFQNITEAEAHKLLTDIVR